jgi:hypothetical protein
MIHQTGGIIMVRFLSISINGILMFLAITASVRAEDEEKEVGYHSSGTVVGISAFRLVLNEPEFESGEEVRVVYDIDKNVVLYNVNKLGEIAVGKKVEVIYKERGGSNVVSVIILVKDLKDAIPIKGEEGGKEESDDEEESTEEEREE